MVIEDEDDKGDVTLVNNVVALAEMLIEIAQAHTLSLSAKGIRLSASGTISIIAVKGVGKVYIIDVMELGSLAFTYKVDDISFGDILTSDKVIKIVFDCRNTTNALFALYKVKLRNVAETQLYFVATRCHTKTRFLPGLSCALETCSSYSKVLSGVREIRSVFNSLYVDAKGGDEASLSKRPIEGPAIAYISLDVYFQEDLYRLFSSQLNTQGIAAVSRETQKRLTLATGSTYEPWHESLKYAPRALSYPRNKVLRKQSPC